MKSYQLSQELRRAIERLFDDPSMALTPLGADRVENEEWYEGECDSSLPPTTRAVRLRATLEKFIGQMAQEHEEMESPEATDTLRMQALGLLIALRELFRHFPEIAATSELRNASGRGDKGDADSCE